MSNDRDAADRLADETGRDRAIFAANDYALPQLDELESVEDTMSETPPRPDGTDPRVVTPSDDEPEVQIAFGQSTGRTYHTADCHVVDRMSDPSTVALSVATWKGYTKCKRCDEREGGDGYPHPGGPGGYATASQLLQGVTPTGCIQIRALLLNGHTREEAAEICGVGDSTVGRHALGRCSCHHEAHTVEYTGSGYVPGDEGGVPTRLTGVTPIDPEVCSWFRRAIVRTGVIVDALADAFGVCSGAVRRHARGECDHDTHVPPATYDDSRGEWITVQIHE